MGAPGRGRRSGVRLRGGARRGARVRREAPARLGAAVSVGGRERDAYRHEDPAPMPARDLLYHDLLTTSVEAAPEREALVFLPEEGPVRRVTYLELDAAVARTARALLASGVGRGGVAAVHAANRPEFVYVQFACSRIGAATGPI